MKYLLSLLFISSSIFASAQSKAVDSASCVAYWKKGETKSLSITHLKEDYKAGKISNRVNFSYIADVIVLDSTATGYKVQWIFHLPESVKSENPLIAKSLPVFEGMKMVFTTTETGQFVELLNWEEVKDAYITMMEVSIPKKLDSAAQAAINKTKELFNSKEMVESTMIKEIQLFHFAYGYVFSTKEIKVDTEIPVPFADQPMPAVQTFKITDLNPKQDYFKLVVDQDINMESAQILLEGILKKMNVDKDTVVAQAKEMMKSFEMKDHSEYQFIQSTGWVKRVVFRRTSKAEHMNQVDSYLIELKD